MNFLDKEIVLYSEKEIKAPKTDSFGRWLCRVYVPELHNDIASIFSSLGCNKYEDNYNEDKVKQLRYDYI